MKELSQTLEILVQKGVEYIRRSDDLGLSRKISPEKWSKKEIIGHLIDSGINNLRRFTEIQFEPKPYQIQSYKQVELVLANNYQAASVDELTDLWQAINRRIYQVILRQTEQTLAYPIALVNGESSDLEFLIRDYVDHLEHHLDQIFDPLYPIDPRLPVPQLLA